jgi:hypothetical protein
MGRGVHWEDEWEEAQGLVVRELDRTISAESWWMGDEAMVKERRVTR